MTHLFGAGLMLHYSNHKGVGGTCPTCGGDEFHFKVGVSIGTLAKFLTGKNENRSKKMVRHRGKHIENKQSKASQVPSYNWPISEKECGMKTRRE
jgi:hypothetical protein